MLRSASRYDILGNLITDPPTTLTYIATSTSTATNHSFNTTSSTTTTWAPGYEQSVGIVHLDVFKRYPSFIEFLINFSPGTLRLIKFGTAIWVPLSLVLLILAVFVFTNWSRLQQPTSRRIAPATVALQGEVLTGSRAFVVYSFLLIGLCILLVLHDMDSAWDMGILTWVRITCPITHGLTNTLRLSITTAVLIIGSRGVAVLSPLASSSPRTSTACASRLLKAGKIPALIFAVIVCTFTGMLNALFWEVQTAERNSISNIDFSETATENLENNLNTFSGQPHFRCETVGGYSNRFQMPFGSDPPQGYLRQRLGFNYALYVWIIDLCLETPAIVTCLALGLVLRRYWLTAHSLISQLPRQWSRGERENVRLAMVICLLHGAINLPKCTLSVFLPVAAPGYNEMPDSQILADVSWLRFLRFNTVLAVAREVSNLTPLVFPLTCFAVSSGFRRHCCRLLGFNCIHQYRRYDWLYRVRSLTARLRYGPQRLRYFRPHCRLLKSKPKLNSNLGALSVDVQPTWSWGKGWHNQTWSQSLISPNEGTLLSRNTNNEDICDPDQLDAIVDDHNAYATDSSSQMPTEEYLRDDLVDEDSTHLQPAQPRRLYRKNDKARFGSKRLQEPRAYI